MTTTTMFLSLIIDYADIFDHRPVQKKNTKLVREVNFESRETVSLCSIALFSVQNYRTSTDTRPQREDNFEEARGPFSIPRYKKEAYKKSLPYVHIA